MAPSRLRRAARPLLLAVFASFCALRAVAFPTEPSPAVVRPAPPPLPAGPDRWLPFRVFDWRDGLSPYADNLALDRHGYLWSGNSEGLRIFNGRAWRPVLIPGEEGPVEITHLLMVGQEEPWIGTYRKGVFRLRSGAWSQLTEAGGLPGNGVNTLTEVDGVVWVGTSRGLARCQGTGCLPVAETLGLSIRGILETRTEAGQPALWLGTNRGLVRLDRIDGPEPRLAPLLFDHRNALPDASVLCLAVSRPPGGASSLWVGTEKGLARLRAGVWTRYDAAPVSTLLSSRWAGRPVLWAGTLGAGLLRIEDDGRWHTVGANVGLPSNNVVDLIATRSGSPEPLLWVATMDGLARLEWDRWHTFGAPSGLPEDSVLGMGETLFPDGIPSYWVTTINGMYRLAGGRWEPYATAAKNIFAVADTREQGDAVFWIAAMDGIHRWSRGRRDLFTSRNSALPHDWAFNLVSVPTPAGGELWARSPLGLTRWAGGHWTAYLDSHLAGHEPSRPAWSFSGSGETVVWTGTSAGVSRFARERWTSFEVPCLPGVPVLSVQTEADARGNGWLWIGTTRGLARMRLHAGEAAPRSCQALTERTRPALVPPRIDQIEIDRQGRAYLCSGSGVTRIGLPGGETALGKARLKAFDTRDGLLGFQLSSASFRDRLGRIWIGAASGLSVFDPELEGQPSTPPPAPLRIERILVNGEERPPASGLVLQYRKRRLEIEYALLRFRREHAIRFQTQLVGLEDQPSPWTREGSVIYDRLPPGRYTFRVWGRDGDGVLSGPAELGFRVQPPLWLTSWALALYALALLGLVYGAVRLRVRTLARQAAHLEALVAERTRDLAEANRRLERASFTDPLTGLGNRRFLSSTIRPDVVQAVRNHREPAGDPHHRDLVVYLLDLDHFKRLNDRAGHDAGDAVLVETARRLREVVRASDLVVRWGGEEILIVSRWTDRDMGALLAERVLQAVGGEAFRTGAERTSTVTCSIGWAPFPWSTGDPEAVLFEEVLSLADHALYLAKRAGRNRGVGVLPGAAAPEEVAERILREEAPLDSLEGLGVELLWTLGPDIADDRTTTTVRTA